MDNMPDFFIPSPEENRLESALRNPRRITLRRASGEVCDLEPKPGQVQVTEEHPQVDRMGGDWGAICEVFRQSSYYYLRLPGFAPAVGDEIQIDTDDHSVVVIKVVDLENGRARIDPPVIRAHK